LKVIGAGFGRTGTLSLKAALEKLGFVPCYHMVEVPRHPGHGTFWKGAIRKW
jgi:sulfotransferase family protein